jgi:hypothetical protein
VVSTVGCWIVGKGVGCWVVGKGVGNRPLGNRWAVGARRSRSIGSGCGGAHRRIPLGRSQQIALGFLQYGEGEACPFGTVGTRETQRPPLVEVVAKCIDTGRPIIVRHT